MPKYNYSYNYNYILRVLSLILTVLPITQAWAQSDAPVASPEPEISFNPADLKDEQDWKRVYFDYIIVVNKAKSAQTINVYRDGQLIMPAPNTPATRVSTGRERPEIADPEKPGSPKLSYFSQTPTGYYTPDRMDIAHHSNQWAELSKDGNYEGAFMPWSIFFNGGIATHRSPFEDLERDPPKVDHNIGHRASGGCVRLHEQDAKAIFWWVRTSSGPFTDKEMNTPPQFGEPNFATESREAEANGLLPYETDPWVPDVDPSTGFFFDTTTRALRPDHGKDVRFHYGPRSLYIVINMPLGREVEEAPVQNGNSGVSQRPLPPAPAPAPAINEGGDLPITRPPVHTNPRIRRRPPPDPNPFGELFGNVLSIFK